MPGAGTKPGMSSIRYIISAPSGSGKTTLVNELRQYVPNLEFSISYTTRPPRGSEQDGREYHFISREEFEAMIARDAFLEYAQVFDKYYGTARSVLQHAEEVGHDLLLDIDVQGERQVKKKMPDAVSIFVLPPSRAELESRLRKRSQSENVHAEEVIRRRLDEARRQRSGEHAPIGGEAIGLDGEYETGRRFVVPVEPVIRRLQRIERAVQLDAREHVRRVREFALLRQIARIKYAAPRRVAPA